MKKWIVVLFMLAVVAGESSCVVRGGRAPHRPPNPPGLPGPGR